MHFRNAFIASSLDTVCSRGDALSSTTASGSAPERSWITPLAMSGAVVTNGQAGTTAKLVARSPVPPR
ncbi:hypothetical protein CAJAP_07202 [Camponotus japonicus]